MQIREGLRKAQPYLFVALGLLALMITPLPLSIMALLAILFIPFAALICAIVAYTKGLNIALYAAAGALYWFLFLIPWVYLIMRMFNKTFPHTLGKACYVIFFIHWGGLVVGYTAFMIHDFFRGNYFISNPLNVLFWIIVTPLNALTLVYSFRSLRHRYSDMLIDGDFDHTILLPKEYIMPLVWPIIWVMVFVLQWVLVFQTL